VISRASLRLSADVVVLALGLNVWLSLVLLPAAFVGSFRALPIYWVAAPLPLAPLLWGLLRRSAPWLLLGFPATLLLPVALDTKALTENAQSAPLFILCAVSLLGFLFGASYLTSLEGGAPTGAERARKLTSTEQMAPRWRRRQRLYVALASLSAIFPLYLLYRVHFDPTARTFLHELYPGRTAPLLAVLDVGVLLAWGALYWIAFLGPLWQHRTGDRGLTRRLEQLRQEARSATPRLVFYVAVLVALGFMAILLWMRLHG